MALSRAGVGLAKSVLGSFIAITLTATLLEVTDQLTIGIVQATGNTMEGIGDRMALLAAGLTTINIASPRRRCDHHDLPCRARHRGCGHRVVHAAHP